MGLLAVLPVAVKSRLSPELPNAISVDVTYRCNLRCKHCYFFQQNHQSELSDDKLLFRLKDLRSKYPIMHASWVGGEPLLRKDLVKAGMQLFPLNMVVTNGILELPDWQNCVFNISVDGTKKYYERVRGPHYDLVKSHADRNDIKVNIACVLNSINIDCIEGLVNEWSQTKVRGVIFDFYTPIKGIKDKLWLSWADRERAIDRIQALKKIYPDFILNSEYILNSMRKNRAEVILRNCKLPSRIYSLDPTGLRKLPCILGKGADCTKCGCIVPYQLADKESFQENLAGYKYFQKIYC